MELKDRQSTHPGRIILKDVQSGEEKTYDVIISDDATELGTPINKQTLSEFKKDVINQAKSEISTVDTKKFGTTYIKGKLVVNPAYDHECNLYNEGIRVNKASNGWSNIEVGGENDSTADTSSDLWFIARRGAHGITSGAIGDLTIECNGLSGEGLTLYKDGSSPTWKGKKILLEDAISLSGTTLTIKL